MSDALQSSAVDVVVCVDVLVEVVDVLVVDVPQAFAVPPPPHVAGAAQDPQLNVLPQPSDTEPHSAPTAVHVVGVQQIPNGFDPGGAPLMHNPPQHD